VYFFPNCKKVKGISAEEANYQLDKRVEIFDAGID
jgi:hypothetical protein